MRDWTTLIDPGARDRPYLVLNYVDVLEAWNRNWTGFVESPEGFFNQLSTASLLSVHRG